MASAFQSGSSGKCQGIDCKSGDLVATFSIKEQQILCEDCVSSKAQAMRDQETQDWSCDKHRQPIKYVCRTHGIPLCQTCAFLLHQKPCTVQDLEDVVREKRSRLEMLIPRVNEKHHELQQKASRIREYGVRGLQQHFKSVKDKIERTFGTESEDIDSLEKRELDSLRKDADEQIRKIEEELNTQLEKRRQTAHSKREKIDRTKQKLADDLIKVQKQTLSKVDKLKSHVDKVMDSVENTQRCLEKLVMDDKDLIGQADMLETSSTRLLDTDININVLERTVQRGQQVHFKFDDNVHESKVLGAEESWELIDRVAIEKDLVKPYFIGAINEEQMVVSDMACRTLYVTNLKDKATNKVLERSGDYRKVVSCTSMSKGTILCGNFCKGATGSRFKGASLYNRQWEFIRDVELPKNPESEQTFASLHVEKGGRILAAVSCQSDIHVISPGDGIVTQSLKTGEGKIQWLRSLPSGNLVAKTGPCEFNIMDSTGSNRICIKNDLWDGCIFDVDLSDGSIYVVYRDKPRNVYVVDVVSSDGELEATKVVEYPVSENRKDVVLPCVVTAPGKLITCNGEYFYVFKLS